MTAPTRVTYLEEAIALTCGDRDREYGPPTVNLDNCAMLFSAYLAGKYAGKIPATELHGSTFVVTAEDVAWLNTLQKIARTYEAVKPDTYIDAAAYSAIAGECRQDHEEDAQ